MQLITNAYVTCEKIASDTVIRQIARFVKCDIEMKNKETPFCEPAQRTKSYVTGEQKGVDTVIRSIAHFKQCGNRENPL